MTEEEMLTAWMPESIDAAEQKATLLIGRIIMADCALDQEFKGQRTFFGQKEMVTATRRGFASTEEASKAAAKAKRKAEGTLWLRDVRRLCTEPKALAIAERVVTYAEDLSKLRNTIAHGLLTVTPPDPRIHEHFLWCRNGDIKRTIRPAPYSSNNLVIEQPYSFVGLSFLENALKPYANVRRDLGSVRYAVSISMEKKIT